MRALEQLPDFMEYLRVCRNHESVGKNDLSALLIAPMKHQCHYQLLLEVKGEGRALTSEMCIITIPGTESSQVHQVQGRKGASFFCY